MPTTDPVSIPAQNSVPSAAAAPAPPPDDPGASALSSDFETFLRMLTVQMENQDPLNPIQSSDFAVQLATFSGVEQQVRTNDLLSEMISAQSLGGLASFGDWVGREARAPVAAPVEQGAAVEVWPNVPADADEATLVVRDAAGAVVTRLAFDPVAAPVVWDGTDARGAPVPSGVYSFVAETARGGEPLSADRAEVYAPVSEVRLEAGGPVIVFGNGDSVAAESVSGLRAPRDGAP